MAHRRKRGSGARPMIPIAAITAWRKYAPWKEQYQIEQDLVLTKAVIQIYSHPALQSAFAFRGGTALHKLFYETPNRYSEDIDLVQVEKKPIGGAIDAIRSLIDPWLGPPQRNTKPDRVSLIYRFESESPSPRKMRLKIEVNTGEHFNILGLQKKKIEAINPWFSGKAEPLTYEIEELLGTKLRALYQRKKGRDLFDMNVAIESFSNLEISKVIDCFLRYMEHDGAVISRAQYEANLADKLEDPAFVRDIEAVLTPGGAKFDPQAAGIKIKERVLSQLAGEPWKGRKEK